MHEFEDDDPPPILSLIATTFTYALNATTESTRSHRHDSEIINALFITSNNTTNPLGEIYEVPVGLLIILSMFYGTISVLAVIGNALVIWIVATTRQMQSVTNLFIANLALADVIIGMFAIPFQFHAAILQRWNLPEFMCAFCPYVQLVSVNVSVFTLTAIAVDRHRAIINPLRARPPKYVCKLAISIIWIVSLSIAAPIAYALRVVQVEESRVFDDGVVTYTKPFCDVVNLTWEQMQQYRYYLVIIQYVIPFCVISFVYIQMAVRLWGSKTPGNAQDSRDVALMRNKKRVIKMLIIVVLLFGVCWFPLQLYNILQVTYSSINEYRYINIIFFCSDWLAMSNSCYNPFIYGIYNEKFKREFRRRFPLFRLRSEPSQSEPSTVSMYTRASSVRSVTNSTSLRNKNLVSTANVESTIGGPAGTQRSCSFNYIEQSTNIRMNSDQNAAWPKSTWVHSSVKFDHQNGEYYPKVVYQHVLTDPEKSPVSSTRINQHISNGTKKDQQDLLNDGEHIAGSSCDVKHCVCFESLEDDAKRYSDEYVEL